MLPPSEGGSGTLQGGDVHSYNIVNRSSVDGSIDTAEPAGGPASTHNFPSKRTMTEMENRIRTLMTLDE